MQTKLTRAFVNGLTIDAIPYLDKSGQEVRVAYRANDKRDSRGRLQSYVVYDSRWDPRGFGIKVNSESKTFIVQRRVGEKVLKFGVADAAIVDLETARRRAHEKIQIALAEGKNPNKVSRERAAAEVTLDEAFDAYTSYLENREQPATTNTMHALEKARSRLVKWENKKITALTSDMILSQFDAWVEKRTTAEQTMRWASAAVAHAIKMELHDAHSQNRSPTLTYNPFLILKDQDRYRTKKTLEKVYLEKGCRNPMRIVPEHLGKWLGAVWEKRSENLNETGCDYLLLTLLWGARKLESAKLAWRHMLMPSEESKSSWVDLDLRVVHFHDTKNRTTLELPLGSAATELLQRRKENAIRDKRKIKWVFPARSTRSHSGYYKDPKELFESIKLKAGIVSLRTHDLRRTFGRALDELGLPAYATKRLLNHSASGDVTMKYSDPDWVRLGEYMQRVENYLLTTAPQLLKALGTQTTNIEACNEEDKS